MRSSSCLLLLFLALPAFAAPQTPAVPHTAESVDVSIVNVDAVVVDKQGNRVRGLRRDEFEIFENGMTDERSDEARETFAYFSNEYAQALQAFKTIEAQSSTLLLMGVGDDLRGFIEQFITMASGTKALAEERGEVHFAEWFTELIRKAEALRSEIVPQ